MSQNCPLGTSARGWCPGKTQRDGMEREAGGGIGQGSTCESMADSCQCMAKTTTIYIHKKIVLWGNEEGKHLLLAPVSPAQVWPHRIQLFWALVCGLPEN